jgi:O-antigen/teichoic acid export membrane protein
MLSSFFFIISPAVASALFAEGSHTPQDVLRKARTSAGIISLLLAPAMLASFLGGRYILLLFGPGYAQHGLLILMIFTISAVPDAITNIYVSVLRVQGRLRNAVLLNLGMAGLNLVLAWMLLPLLGTAGPPSAFLIAQVAGSLVAGVDFIRIRQQRRGLASQGDSGSVEMQNS